MQDITFIDTETTGLDESRHEIIELAAIRTTGPDFEVIKQNSWKIKPGRIETASAQALRINGYSEEAWEGAPSISHVLSELIPFLEGAIPAGHNVQFDLRFLKVAWNAWPGLEPDMNYRSLDTVSLVFPLALLGETTGVSLSKVHSILCPRESKPTHRALADALASRQIAIAAMRVWKYRATGARR